MFRGNEDINFRYAEWKEPVQKQLEHETLPVRLHAIEVTSVFISSQTTQEKTKNLQKVNDNNLKYVTQGIKILKRVQVQNFHLLEFHEQN